ncbi:gluconolaconase [Pelagibius litoralis]|uniref:Gluconolaconase n=1 Tax=Pelagibius litoralis TaxID=374515 RepID=A0A967F0N4_9PROT|nr:gluconolaconase [Pelagibius litoralis]NIA70910.1 gluconolaconase [Pelagibius litoralis]
MTVSDFSPATPIRLVTECRVVFRSATACRNRLLAFLSALIVLGPLMGPHHAQAEVAAQSIPLPKGFDYPNGIAVGPEGDLFVGSVTAGHILRVSTDGTTERAFQETDEVFAGTSLRFDTQTGLLWVTSPDFLGQEINGERVRRPHRIAAIDLSQGEVVWSSTIPDQGFANDIALDNKGGIYVTDSIGDRILHLAAPGASFETIADDAFFAPGDLGPAGIVMTPSGDLIVGLYSDGALFRVRLNEVGAEVVPLNLTRKIQNPDGLAMTDDGRLLILEGAVQSGDGKLLVVDLEGPAPLLVEPLVDGLDMPLNLTVFGNKVAVTEGRLRHFMLDDPSLAKTGPFRVVVVTLEEE